MSSQLSCAWGCSLGAKDLAETRDLSTTAEIPKVKRDKRGRRALETRPRSLLLERIQKPYSQAAGVDIRIPNIRKPYSSLTKGTKMLTNPQLSRVLLRRTRGLDFSAPLRKACGHSMYQFILYTSSSFWCVGFFFEASVKSSPCESGTPLHRISDEETVQVCAEDCMDLICGDLPSF